MSDFIRVPRAFKKRSKRSVLLVPVPVADGGSVATASLGENSEMGRKSFKEKKSFKRGSVKERWLLTRKTWKFMADAGRRLLPEGVRADRAEDIPKIEQYFQEVCRSEPRFLLWRRKCSYPGASGPLPSRRRWKRRVGTVSPKKACSADEAEDDYFDTLEQQQCEQLMIDMLKNYLDIKDDEEEDELEADLGILRKGRLGISTTTSMVSLDTPSMPLTTTATITNDPDSKFGFKSTAHAIKGDARATGPSAVTPSANTTSGLRSTQAPNTPFSLFSFGRDSAPAHLLTNMRRYARGSALMDRISPALLNDKVALRQLYDQLIVNRRLNRLTPSSSTYRIPNPKPHYQRSALGLHKTFAFPELTGKSSRSLHAFNKSGIIDENCPHYFLNHLGDLHGSTAFHGVDARSLAEGEGKSPPKVSFSTGGIQTDAIPLPTLKELSAEYTRCLEHEEALLREDEMAHVDVSVSAARNNDRRNSEDVSQSVSDTIKRYLRMARKKPAKDDVNRFKRINYDQTLRNIKAKGETTKIGDDDGNSKGCQTDSDWIVKSFGVLSEHAPKVVPIPRPTTLPRPKSSYKHDSSAATSPISSPSSPPGLGSNIFHTSTQFLSNLFGHTPSTTGSGSQHGFEGCSSNDSIYGSSDAATMQKSKSSSNVGHMVSRKIWKSRSKSQSRPAAKPQWTPQVP